MAAYDEVRGAAPDAGAAELVDYPAGPGCRASPLGPGGLWFSTSSTRCGALEGPDGTVSFVPGGEDVGFRGRTSGR